MDIHRFDVLFNPGTKEIKIPGLDKDHPLHTDQAFSLILFTLVSIPDDLPNSAVFAGDPIQWMAEGAGGKLAALPPWFLMHRFDDRHFALWNFNSTPKTTPHQFELSVWYEEQIYSSTDPVIVNEPPSG